MTLLDPKTILQDDPVLTESGFAEVLKFESHTSAILIRNRQSLKDAIGDIIPGQNIYFINHGRWSAHDLLFYILSITGPADLYLTAWAISEKAARLVQSACDQGLLKSVHAIFDRRIEIRNARVMATVRNFCTSLVFVDCHAKLFVISNERWSVTVMTTANLSNNLRIEAGHIYTDPAIMEMTRSTIIRTIETQKPFE